jgi:phosphocarrier protein
MKMKSFTYTIKDKFGIHARPAGLLVKEAKKYISVCILEMDGKSVELTKLLALMGLGAVCGSTVTVTAQGDDEEQAIEGLKDFFNNNL